MIGQIEERILVGLLHVGEPILGHAVREEVVVGDIREQLRFRRRRLFDLDVFRDDDFLDPLPDFHELRRAGLRMPLQSPPLGPLVGLVVVIHVAKQEAGRGLVDDQADVGVYPDRPEIRILRSVDPMEPHAGIRRIELQIERRRLDRLLLVVTEPGEGGGEGVGDAELHWPSTAGLRVTRYIETPQLDPRENHDK